MEDIHFMFFVDCSLGLVGECSEECGIGSQTLTVYPTCDISQPCRIDNLPCTGYKGCKGINKQCLN